MSRHSARELGGSGEKASRIVARLAPEYPTVAPLPALGPGTVFSFFLKPSLGVAK